jgi:hypothetical protein
MKMTLGEALTANDDSASFLEDQSIKDGYDEARAKLDKERKKLNRRALLDAEAPHDALKKAFFKALDIALDDILARAWAGWEELRQLADPEKTPPDEIHRVTVSDHTIESQHEPSVDIVLDGIPFHTFDFKVTAKLDVQGIDLQVQGGEITAIRLGSLKLGGVVKLGDRQLLEKDIAQVTLDDVMHLAKPIPIRAKISHAPRDVAIDA